MILGRVVLQSTFVYGITRACPLCMLSSRSFHHGTDFPPASLVQHVGRGHKSSAAARMKHKCGMSLHSWTCVSSVSGEFCSQKAAAFVRQYQSRHFGPSQPNAPGRLGRKTQARFQCLLFKISSCLRQQAKADHVEEQRFARDNLLLIKAFSNRLFNRRWKFRDLQVATA